jgi:hypothetical protein
MTLTLVFAAVGSLLLLLLIVLLWQPSSFELEYWREGKDDRLLIYFRGPFGLIFQRFEISVADLVLTHSGPAINYQQEPREALGEKTHTVSSKIAFSKTKKLRAAWRKLRPAWEAYAPAANYLLRHVHLQALTWETRLGMQDAAATGMLVGAVWAAKGALLTWLQRYFPVQGERSSVTVSPYFNRAYFSTFFHCIFTIRLVHVINVQLRLLGYKLRQGKR